MVFDAVVGNPPYQEETVKQQSATNGQARSKSIFQYFQMAADQVSSGAVSLIYPGARWLHRSGKGMAEFGLNQINDVHLEKIDFYPDSQDIFKDVAIADGISIVYKSKKKTTPGFKYFYHKDGNVISVELSNPGEDLIPLNPQDGSIVEKVVRFVEENGLSFVHDRVLSQKLFGIESSFVEDNPTRVRLYTDDADVDFKKEIKLFTNDKAGKAGRSTWYIVDRDVISVNAEYIDQWKVVVSSANAGGQKRDNQIEIVDNHSAFGRSRVALGSFKTKEEAENFYNYCRTPLIRFMFLMTDESLTSLAKKVPDLIDYTAENGLIDFSGDISRQLYHLICLTDDEIKYVEYVIRYKDEGSECEKMR